MAAPTEERRESASKPLSLGVLLRMAGPIWVVKLALRWVGRTWRRLMAPRTPRAQPAVVKRRYAGPRPRFFFDSQDLPSRVELVERLIDSARKRTLVAANDALAHRFDLLGSGPTDLGPEIDWHTDFKTGYRWPLEHYLRPSRSPSDLPRDPKVPWELSRCYHFVALGKAYALTGDERYAKEFVEQITSWLAANPTGFGINWIVTMEVAIRAVNWIWGYQLMQGARALTPEFEARFLQAMDHHGRHIIRNLETWWPPTNHLVADLCGLIYLGVMFPQLKESNRWLRRGLRGLKQALDAQVHPDGVVDEGATSYHRLVTELSLSPVLLCHRSGIPVPGALWTHLEKMLDVIRTYTRPDGLAPAIGDADDGRLHVLGSYPDKISQARDHRHLLGIGAVHFNRPDLASAAGNQWEDALWLLGEPAARMIDTASEPQRDSATFFDGGLFFMRHEDLYLSIDAGPHGHGGTGGHAHNDTLSITLSAHGIPFLVDSGAYAYTANPQARNRFRATDAHNTLAVDGQEINRFRSGDVFFLQDDATQTVHHWQSTRDFDLFDASHDGYARLPGHVIHRRQILFDKQERFWLLRDVLTGEDKHDLLWPYHFAPALTIEAGASQSIIANEAIGGLLILPLEPETLELVVGADWISPSYGLKQRAPLAKYTRRAILPATITFVLYPYQVQHPPLDRVRAAGQRAIDRLDTLLNDETSIV